VAASLALAVAAREPVLDRLAWQVAELHTSRDKIAVANAAALKAVIDKRGSASAIMLGQ